MLIIPILSKQCSEKKSIIFIKSRVSYKGSIIFKIRYEAKDNLKISSKALLFITILLKNYRAFYRFRAFLKFPVRAFGNQPHVRV